VNSPVESNSWPDLGVRQPGRQPAIMPLEVADELEMVMERASTLTNNPSAVVDAAGPAGLEDPDGDRVQIEESRRAIRNARPDGERIDTVVAARVQRAYESYGDSGPTAGNQRHHSPSNDAFAASTLSTPRSDNAAPRAEVQASPAMPPHTVNYDARPALAALMAPPTALNTDPTVEALEAGSVRTVETPEPDTADRLVQSLRMQFLRGGGDAVVHIRPEHLGPLTVSVRVEQGSVSAHVSADNAVVAEWLQANEQLLRDSLKASGLNLERFVVHKDPDNPGRNARRDSTPSRHHHRRRDDERRSTFDITV
jgi:hypothetical protein